MSIRISVHCLLICVLLAAQKRLAPLFFLNTFKMTVLLINPPTAKICEPPAGIARIAGVLKSHNIRCIITDLNLECMLNLIEKVENNQADTWSRRAYKNRHHHLSDLRSDAIYCSPDRYRRAVKDLNRLLQISGSASGSDISLSNYSNRHLSPLKSADLLAAAEQFDHNPFYSGFSDILDRLIAEDSPTIIGVSISFLSQALTGFAILGYIRSHFPSIITVAGGSLITSWMSGPNHLSGLETAVDHLVKGPGEERMLELADAENGCLEATPDYSGFKLADYLTPGPILPYSCADGCYWSKCSFCPDKAEGRSYRPGNPDTVGRQISHLLARHTPRLIHFLDNGLSPQQLKRLASHPPGAPWYGFSRIERVLENPEFCIQLRRSGCVMLKLGVESGSQKVLDGMHKGIELPRVSLVLKNLKAAGIGTYVYLLFGTPYETEHDAELTLSFIRAHHQFISYLNCAVFNMPVCSPEAADVPYRFSDGDLALYCDFRHPQGWDRKSVKIFLQNRFKKDPAIHEIIQRDPLFFTSNHAPLFLHL